jgi:hypothetical protein
MGIAHQFRSKTPAPKPKQQPAHKPVEAQLSQPNPIAEPLPNHKRGRPRIEDKDKTLTATKPWVALGMCRRTWEKRRKEWIGDDRL